MQLGFPICQSRTGAYSEKRRIPQCCACGRVDFLVVGFRLLNTLPPKESVAFSDPVDRLLYQDVLTPGSCDRLNIVQHVFVMGQHSNASSGKHP